MHITITYTTIGKIFSSGANSRFFQVVATSTFAVGDNSGEILFYQL